MPDDMIINLNLININIEKRSIPFLKDCEVNYDNDTFGGQLTIKKAPNARLPNISPNSPVEDRINYVIYNEINPMLESHGGEVSLVEFKNNEAVLQFGGGCQGCGMVDVTLKDGIEKTLVEQIPEVKNVKDLIPFNRR